jgi:hypothetical protein
MLANGSEGRRRQPLTEADFQRRIRHIAYAMLLATAGLLVAAAVVAPFVHSGRVTTGGLITAALLTLWRVVKMNPP